MRHFVLILAFALAPVLAVAQTSDTDSISAQELKEIVVEGRTHVWWNTARTYGKKVNRNGEFQQSGGLDSAILK